MEEGWRLSCPQAHLSSSHTEYQPYDTALVGTVTDVLLFGDFLDRENNFKNHLTIPPFRTIIYGNL